ncbi:MAG TPA: IMP cyclohydrolase [Myxococcota bacterium]|nr:IMP cyclohydrolase [Myxococcota bacterium]
MYVGRIVAVGRTKSGANAALYRVSSRSFPNRMAVEVEGRLAVVPRPGHEGDLHKNPYIAYNCVRIAGDLAVATNGSHTDPIAEKLALGVPPRDALASVLLALDYEKDALQTPRIAGIVPREGDVGWLAIVRDDALVVRAVPLEPGRAAFVATYERDDVDAAQASEFDAADAAACARFAVDGGAFAALEKPVTAGAALASSRGFRLGTFLVNPS